MLTTCRVSTSFICPAAQSRYLYLLGRGVPCAKSSTEEPTERAVWLYMALGSRLPPGDTSPAGGAMPGTWSCPMSSSRADEFRAIWLILEQGVSHCGSCLWGKWGSCIQSLPQGRKKFLKLSIAPSPGDQREKMFSSFLLLIVHQHPGKENSLILTTGWRHFKLLNKMNQMVEIPLYDKCSFYFCFHL